MIVRNEFSELLSYDPTSGSLVWNWRDRDRFNCDRLWRSWNTKNAGKSAGCLMPSGYICVRVAGRTYKAHRLAWLLAHDRWPEGVIDHINRVRSDNRLINLREVPWVINCRNRQIGSPNKSGILGVYWHRATQKWAASINAEFGSRHLGVFDSKEDAIAARKSAERRLGYITSDADRAEVMAAAQ